MSSTDKVIAWMVKNYGFVFKTVGVIILCVSAVAVLFFKVDGIGKDVSEIKKLVNSDHELRIKADAKDEALEGRVKSLEENMNKFMRFTNSHQEYEDSIY